MAMVPMKPKTYKSIYTIPRPTSLPTTLLWNDVFSRMDQWDNKIYDDMLNHEMDRLIISSDSGESIRQKWSLTPRDLTWNCVEFQKQDAGIQKAWGKVVEVEKWFEMICGGSEPRDPFGPPVFTPVIIGTLGVTQWPFGTIWIDGTTYYLPGMFGPPAFEFGPPGTPQRFFGPPPGIPIPRAPGTPEFKAPPLFGYPTLDGGVKKDIPDPFAGLRGILKRYDASGSLRGILKPSGSYETATNKKKVKFDIPAKPGDGAVIVKSPLEKIYGLAIDMLLGDLSELL